ncbi:hypothetical protein AAFX24_17470 [Vibrio mediterranei]|uniref:hypothetical protein n=1 Tax=Vibrio mediterranei TaxID=689 RepID=UPI0038CE0CFD
MQNVAGHGVSLFLFQFVIANKGVSFVLNEAIAEDLYPESETTLTPLVHACCETLLRYQHQCPTEVIMDGNILHDGDFEVMLSPGLGRRFHPEEKKRLFSDAHEIAKLLLEVMDKRTLEMEQGRYPGPQPVLSTISRTGGLSQELEALGKKQREATINQGQHNSHSVPLTPQDLPYGVKARDSYDHRGHCMMFEHETIGVIGKVVLVDEGSTCRVLAELSKEDMALFDAKKSVLEDIITIIERAMNRNQGN